MCGLTVAIDGSEDDQLHCFKPNGPIPEGRAILEQLRMEHNMDALALVENPEEAEEMIEETGFGNDLDGYQSDESMDFE